MTVTVKTSGSQTSVITTEHTLATVTDAGVYQVSVDTANMVGGDELEIRIYGKCRSGDTERVAYLISASQLQGSPLKLSPVVISPHHMKVTLKQTAGSPRAFPWAVYVT